jgi:KaiC/GvpD/RAD55 family RecA-like ATPase/chromosome segregation ATPase
MAEHEDGKDAVPDGANGGEATPEVMENGGSASSEANVPQPMRRYVVAFRRTLHGRSQAPLQMLMGPEAACEESPAEGQMPRTLSLGPDDLREIQETFNVHSIEEMLETLKLKEEELVRIKSDFSIKMRNSLALQRIKFEKELSDMKKRMEEFSEFTDAESFLKKREEEIKRKERSLEDKGEELDELRKELEALKKSGRVAASTGDVAAGEGKDAAELREIIEEQAMEVTQLETAFSKTRTEMEELRAEAEKEARKRQETQDELDNLKKGSIAMMKYVTSMQRKKAEDEITDLKRSLEDEVRRREELQEELSRKETAQRAKDVDLDKAISDAVSAGAKGMDLDTIARLNQEIRDRHDAIEAKEKDLKLKERKIVAQLRKLKEERERAKAIEREAIDDRMQQLPDFQEQILRKDEEVKNWRNQAEVLEEELSKVKRAVTYKDDEFARRQQDIEYREKMLEAELAKLSEAKRSAGGSSEVLAARKEVERLEKVIASKEAELKTKEAYLAGKERELQVKEQAVISNNLRVASKEREAEFKSNKIKTGTARLDDLLYGGLPMGANVLILGPAFIGKEVLIEGFIAEGLTKGIPTVLILSDLAPQEMRTSLGTHLSSVEEYENLGMLKYIDAYSLPMGMEPEEDNPHITYLSEATAYQDIIAAMDKLYKEFTKAGIEYFRVVVLSISTFITYSDVKATYGFLQKLTGRLKLMRAVSLYSVDEGMHTATDIQMLGHVMDGSFVFKAENLKTYIAILGVCDTQSRDWIQYQYTKKGLNIGSFTLTHIR